MGRLTSLSFAAGALLAACASESSRFTPSTADGGARDAPPADVATVADAATADVPSVTPGRDLFVDAPADSAGRFGGADDPSRAPSFVYPEDETIVPPNLPSFEVHFRPGRGNDLFEVSFTAGASAVRVYTRCNEVEGGCVLALDEAAFQHVADVARASGRVRVGLRGTSSAAGSAVGSPAPITLGVTPAPVRGGIYYWQAATGTILRYDFGRSGARPETYLASMGLPLGCVGCHVLSRDGSRIAVGRMLPAPAAGEVLDVATRASVTTGFGMNYGSFSPDNRRLIVSDGRRLALLDSANGMNVPGLPADVVGTMPDWAPDNSRVIFARAQNAVPAPFDIARINQAAPADLMLMGNAGGTFTAPAVFLRSMGENNYYPSFSPDSAWIVFNRSRESSEDVVDARLWAIRADGRGGAVELARANGPGERTNSWPKWAPFAESYTTDVTEPLLWVTFSSKRDYGLRLRNRNCESGTVDGCRAQLWMTAFRPGRTGDPSSPPFWLPFQNLNAGYHIAQWVQEVRRRDCTADRECGSQEFCVGGRCIGAPP